MDVRIPDSSLAQRHWRKSVRALERLTIVPSQHLWCFVNLNPLYCDWARGVVLNQKWFCPPRGIWQCLETAFGRQSREGLRLESRAESGMPLDS